MAVNVPDVVVFVTKNQTRWWASPFNILITSFLFSFNNK